MSKKTKLAIGLAAFFVLLCGTGGFAVLRYVDFPIASAELPKAWEEAKAAGVPLVAAQIQIPGQVLATNQDVAELARFNSGKELAELSNTMNNLTSTKADWGRAERLFAPHLGDLNKARQIAARGAVSTHKDWDLGVDLLFPEFAGAKATAKALAVNAMLCAKRGDVNGAARDLKILRHLGQASGRAGTLIGMLVQIAIDTITFRATEVCMAALHERGQSTAPLATEVLTPTTYDYVHALRCEAYFQVCTIRNLHRYGGVTGILNTLHGSSAAPAPKGPLVREGMPSNMVERAFMARSLQFWSRVFTAIEPLKSDMLALTAEVDRQSKPLEVEENPLSYKLLEIMTPVFSQAGKAVIKGEADRQVKFALSEVLDYRLKHGKFPPDLASAGVTELDPFDKKPLRYRTDGKEVRVWSIGVDGKDDNGRASFEKKGGSRIQDVDVVAAYPFIRNAPTPVATQKK